MSGRLQLYRLRDETSQEARPKNSITQKKEVRSTLPVPLLLPFSNPAPTVTRTLVTGLAPKKIGLKSSHRQKLSLSHAEILEDIIG